MKRLTLLAILITAMIVIIESGRTDLVELNHAQITLIALGVTASVFIVVYTLCKVWERRLNK